MEKVFDVKEHADARFALQSKLQAARAKRQALEERKMKGETAYDNEGRIISREISEEELKLTEELAKLEADAKTAKLEQDTIDMERIQTLVVEGRGIINHLFRFLSSSFEGKTVELLGAEFLAFEAEVQACAMRLDDGRPITSENTFVNFWPPRRCDFPAIPINILRWLGGLLTMNPPDRTGRHADMGFYKITSGSQTMSEAPAIDEKELTRITSAVVTSAIVTAFEARENGEFVDKDELVRRATERVRTELGV